MSEFSLDRQLRGTVERPVFQSPAWGPARTYSVAHSITVCDGALISLLVKEGQYREN